MPDVEIVLDSPELCPRYAGAVADVRVGASPAWMQQRLTASGLKRIGRSVVDLANAEGLTAHAASVAIRMKEPQQ